MKQVMFVGALAASLAAAPAWVQANTAGKSAEAGQNAPKTQPPTAPEPSVPTGEVALGSIRIPRTVKADGKTLPAGTYQIRVTAQVAAPAAKGQTAALERWAEFVQKGEVKGREVVVIVPQQDASTVNKDAPPKANDSKFEMLKGGDYTRLWINKGGNHYLVFFPSA